MAVDERVKIATVLETVGDAGMDFDGVEVAVTIGVRVVDPERREVIDSDAVARKVELEEYVALEVVEVDGDVDSVVDVNEDTEAVDDAHDAVTLALDVTEGVVETLTDGRGDTLCVKLPATEIDKREEGEMDEDETGERDTRGDFDSEPVDLELTL